MPQSPFKLFEPYGPGDKDIFFGRDAEIFALYHLLQQTRIALIYGASGTGKTSLINAGLPKVFKLTDWFRVFIRRRDNINDSLRGELNRLRGHHEPITDLPQVIHEIFETRWIPVYLVFDQFEEIFTLGTSEERKVFFQDLQQLLTVNLPCKVILSMREEYIGHLYDYEPQVPALFEKRFRVESMQDNMVQGVIAQMCSVNGIELEHPETVEANPNQSASTAARILEQLKEGKQAAHLPYLQIYLHYLYEHAVSTLGKARFTESSIQAIGKLGNVLKRFIETKLTEAQIFLRAQQAPEDFAQQLLDEFATDEGTKQSRKRVELAAILDAPPGLIQVALSYFSDTAKLLRADEDEVDRYEPVHDVVAKQIHELRTAEDKEFKAFTRHLQLSCDRWLAEQRPTDRLLPERDLSRADIYRERLERREEYQQHWKTYVEESNRYRQRQQSRRRWFTLFVSAIAIIAIGAGIVAVMLNGQAQQQKRQAEQAKNEAINNLRLYKKEELSRYLLDAETYLASGDSDFALSVLDSAQAIQKAYFQDVEDWQLRIDSLRQKAAGQ